MKVRRSSKDLPKTKPRASRSAAPGPLPATKADCAFAGKEWSPARQALHDAGLNTIHVIGGPPGADLLGALFEAVGYNVHYAPAPDSTPPPVKTNVKQNRRRASIAAGYKRLLQALVRSEKKPMAKRKRKAQS